MRINCNLRPTLSHIGSSRASHLCCCYCRLQALALPVSALCLANGLLHPQLQLMHLPGACQLQLTATYLLISHCCITATHLMPCNLKLLLQLLHLNACLLALLLQLRLQLFCFGLCLLLLLLKLVP